MRVVELDRVAEPYWDELIAGEREPFGGAGEQLSWGEKTRNLGLRDDDGRLLAAGGLVLARLRARGGEPFEVAGLGGVIVTRGARGRGLGRMLVRHLTELARELPVAHAMLFCLPRLMPFYAEFDFRRVRAPVWADQPGGRIEMPLEAMWKPLRERADWPTGEIELDGEPF